MADSETSPPVQRLDKATWDEVDRAWNAPLERREDDKWAGHAVPHAEPPAEQASRSTGGVVRPSTQPLRGWLRMMEIGAVPAKMIAHIEEGLRQARAAEFASDAEIAAAFRRRG